MVETTLPHVIKEHLSDAKWSQWVPLQWQEYRRWLADDPRFDRRLQDVYQEWKLGEVVDEAVRLIEQLSLMKAQLSRGLHMLQAQAMARLGQVFESIEDMKILEIGCREGALFRELEARGGKVTGIDLDPKIGGVIKGNFFEVEFNRKFNLIIATAVFEAGSSPPTDYSQLLPVLSALTQPGSVVVIENVSFAIPFSPSDAAAFGFDAILTPVPSANTAFGGRGCTLRKR